MRLVDADAFIKMMEERCDHTASLDEWVLSVCRGGIKTMPTIEQSHWILCNERMPEEHEWMGTKRFGTTISDEVYVTFERPDGQRFTKHISFQNGKLSSSDKRLMEVWYNDAKPIAWMPLPESYRGDAE